MAKLWCLIKESENQITFDSFVGLALKGLREKKEKHKQQAKQSKGSKGKGSADFHQGNHGLNCQSNMCVLSVVFSITYQRKGGPNCFEQEYCNFFKQKEKRRGKPQRLSSLIKETLD